MQDSFEERRRSGRPDEESSEPKGVFELASVGDGTFESALSVQVVFQELTIFEDTLNEFAVGKTRASKNAIFEAALDEVGHVEESPVPVDIFE